MTTLAAGRAWQWRTRELLLLAFPCLVLLLGLLSIDLARAGSVEQGTVWSRWPVFAGLLLGVHLWLSWRYPRSDQLLLPLGGALAAVGLVMVERLAPELAGRQLLWLSIALVTTAVALSLLPSVQWLRGWKYTSAALGLVLVATTFVLGVDPNGSGARLWLSLGGVFFQPSELLKLLLVAFLAAYLDETRELIVWGSPRWGWLRLPPLPYLAPLLVMLTLSLAVVVLQRDLGAALLYFGVFLAMLYVASGYGSYAALGFGAFLLGAALMHQLFAHLRVRVEAWLDPWADPRGSGHQIIQALVALASGGILGVGLTHGYPGFIPAVHTDFIIAAIGEELGLVGTLGVVALYVVWLHRGLTIALAAHDSFACLLAVGLTVALALQALVILAGTLLLVPLTGITLPFVSYGGSSLLVNFLMLGLLLAISSQHRETGHG